MSMNKHRTIITIVVIISFLLIASLAAIILSRLGSGYDMGLMSHPPQDVTPYLVDPDIKIVSSAIFGMYIKAARISLGEAELVISVCAPPTKQGSEDIIVCKNIFNLNPKTMLHALENVIVKDVGMDEKRIVYYKSLVSAVSDSPEWSQQKLRIYELFEN